MSNLKLRVAAIGLFSITVVAIGRKVNWRYVASWLLNKTGETYVYKAETLRSRFVDEEMVKVKTPTHHTHGSSAAYRSTGSLFAEQFAKSLGRKIWFYQCSRSDQRNNRLGSRQYYWAKDLNADAAPFWPSAGDLIAMIDVDQYVNMHEFALKHFLPMIIYTFQPSKVASVEKEYSYTFSSDNTVVYKVRGGANYNHEVWNYNCDVVLFQDKWMEYPYHVAVYLIDKRQVDEDHQVILLTPLKRWWGLSAFLARILEGHPLERLHPVIGSFTRMSNMGPDGMLIHTGRVDEFVCCTSPAPTDSYLASIARTSKVGLTLPQVRDKVENLYPQNRAGVAILYEFLLSKLSFSPPITYSLSAFGDAESGVRRYQFIDNGYDPDAKRSLSAFMRPLIHGAFCPDICTANDKQAIVGRIEKVRTTTTLDPFLIRCVDEFIGLFLMDLEGTLGPVEPDDVYEHQDRPTQRRILMDSEFRDPKRRNDSFMKREAYQKISDPRIISTINGPDKAAYSQFIYAISNVLKTKDWYAFAKTPLEISERVAYVCLHAKTAGNTDFSRMDGHISEVLRYLEKQLMLRAFRSDYSEKLLDLMRAQQNLPGRMGRKDPILYSQGLARASGSPETSAFNTIDNAFIAYLAFRMSRNSTGHYYQPIDAYDRLGIYGGDDGVTADINPKIYVRAAQRCGQKLEIEMIPRGSMGIKFLSRIYGPHVWWGETITCADLYRALSKFHVAVNLPPHISVVDKLLDKSFAYWLTDQYTPVLGDFVSKVMEFKPTDYEFTNLGQSWNARYPKDIQYPNEYRDWFLDVFNEQIQEFKYRPFLNWIDKADSLFYLLSPPRFYPIPAVVTKERVVVDGDIVQPPSQGVISPAASNGQRPRTRSKKLSRVSRKSDKAVVPRAVVNT